MTRRTANQPDNQPAILKTVLGASTRTAESRDSLVALEALKVRLRNDEEGGAKAASPRKSHKGFSGRSLPRWVGYSGFASAILVLLAVVYHLSSSYQASDTASNPVTVYSTTNGQRASIQLGDGTRITLNVASRLEVLPGFGRESRTVRLSGQAVFDVTNRTGLPFIVDAPRTRTTVLGTHFSVRAYPTDTTTSVAVRTGKVAVSAFGNTVVEAGKLARVGAGGALLTDMRVPELFSFASDSLVFGGVHLRDAIPDLNRWFNADIRLANPALGNRLIEGVFGNESVTDLAHTLGSVFNVRVVRNGNVLTLYPLSD